MDWWSIFFSPPNTCWFCSTPVRSSRFAAVWKQVCTVCQDQIEPITERFCHSCGRLMADERPAICLDCTKISEGERVCNRSAVTYSDWVKQIIQIYKYRGKESLATPLGLWMAEVAARHFRLRRFAFITFVPLYPDRLHERGFNQAELLAGVMGKRLGLPVVPLLERCKSTSSQSQRSRQERLLALKNVFRLGKEVNRKQIANKTILIVDDVYTTGTTLRECAKPLRQAGVNDVCSVTFAR